MTQERLDIFKENAAQILIQFTNGYLNSIFNGTGENLIGDCVRLHYLCGIIDEAYLSGGDVYVGDTVLDSIGDIYHKIWHYNGIYDIDLTDFDTVVPDNGDGGVVENNGTVVVDHNQRVGERTVGTGANVVTFYLGGVPTPFPSTNYEVDAWLITNSGYMQRQVVVSNKLANGFTVEDILESGVLHYQATLNT